MLRDMKGAGESKQKTGAPDFDLTRPYIYYSLALNVRAYPRSVAAAEATAAGAVSGAAAVVTAEKEEREDN